LEGKRHYFNCRSAARQLLFFASFGFTLVDSCCAIGCTNRRGDKPGLCFYRIPSEKENPERRRLWICALRRASVPGENKQWQPSKYTRLCSEHFIKGKVKLVSQHSILIIVLSVIIYLRIRSDMVCLSGPMHPTPAALLIIFSLKR
jgi:hypothetical protein